MEERARKIRDARRGILRMVVVLLLIALQIWWIVYLILRLEARVSWLSTLVTYLAFILCVWIYRRHINAGSKLSWILLIMAFPIIGSVLYVLGGSRVVGSRMYRQFAVSEDKFRKLQRQDPAVMGRLRRRDLRAGGRAHYLAGYAGSPVWQNTDVLYFDDAQKGLEAQIRALRGAKDFIFMEYLTIEDSVCFKPVADILKQKAAEGVKVRVIYDDVGSILVLDKKFIKEMEASGVECRVFNPMAPILNVFMNNRDHRKITVVDGRIGFTGGYNIARQYFHITEPCGFWKDTGVRLVGDAVQNLTTSFLIMWDAIDGEDADISAFYPENFYSRKSGGDGRRPDRKAERESGIHSGKKKDSQAVGQPGSQSDRQPSEETGEAPGEVRAEVSDSGRYESRETGFVQPYSDSPLDNEPVGEEVYLDILRTARRYVWFVTPYLVITDEMRREMIGAAKRGVDVRILTPGIPDKKLMYQVTRSYYPHLIRGGVRIFEYTPGFSHAKMCVSDDCAATVGTINLDYRSLYLHFENGVLFEHCAVVHEISRDFEKMFAVSRERDRKHLRSRNLFVRGLQVLLRLFAPLL